MEETEYKMTNLFKLLFIILVIILVFYTLTNFITTKKKNTDENENLTEIQYNEILIGSIYNVTSDEHYVLVELESDYLELNNIVSSYSSKEEAIKIYTANLNHIMNQKYFKEESNFETRFPIFKETTLIKVENDSIVEYYEGIDKIKEVLK